MSVSPVLRQLIRRTGLLALIFVAAKLLPQFLDFPARWDAKINATLHVVAVVALFFQAVVWAGALVNHWSAIYLERHRDEYGAATTIGAIAVFVRVAFVIVLGLMALRALDVDVTPLVAGLGISGIAIAFALQSILGDLFGALSIVLDKPFVVGDAIQIDTFSGRVERIGLKSTRIRSDTGEQLVFSNGDLLKGRLRNFQLMQERRVTLVTRLAGDTPPELAAKVPKILKELIEKQPHTRFARSHLKQIAETTIEFETVFFLSDPAYNLMMDTQQAIQFGLMRRCSEEGIQLSVVLEAKVRRKTAGLDEEPAVASEPIPEEMVSVPSRLSDDS